jgi:hypothetical protein
LIKLSSDENLPAKAKAGDLRLRPQRDRLSRAKKPWIAKAMDSQE